MALPSSTPFRCRLPRQLQPMAAIACKSLPPSGAPRLDLSEQTDLWETHGGFSSRRDNPRTGQGGKRSFLARRPGPSRE
jgi:hypothetical protein